MYVDRPVDLGRWKLRKYVLMDRSVEVGKHHEDTAVSVYMAIIEMVTSFFHIVLTCSSMTVGSGFVIWF